MLNRRAFLKTSLKTSAAIPIGAGFRSLDASAINAAEEGAQAPVGRPIPKLIALPPRMAALDPAGEPWQQRVHRVGQSNMTEHDPAVMNIEEWANYWHRAEADLVFISVTGILAFIPRKFRFTAMESTSKVAISSASAWPLRRSAVCGWWRA